MSETGLPCRTVAGGLRIALKVTPKASRDRIGGIAQDADGAARLKVAVTAPPEEGKANRAVVKLLAKRWGLPKSALSIVAGETGRRKELMLAGEPEAVIDWMKRTLNERRQ